MVTYRDNIKYKSDIPLLAYIDFGTAAPTDSCLNSEDKKMSAVPYVIILVFHPELKLGRIKIEGSFRHSPDNLLNIDYLTQGKIKFINPKTLFQLRDTAIAVANCRDKLAVSTMFNIELKLLLILC